MLCRTLAQQAVRNAGVSLEGFASLGDVDADDEEDAKNGKSHPPEQPWKPTTPDITHGGILRQPIGVARTPRSSASAYENAAKLLASR